jgi:hypothetical protein
MKKNILVACITCFILTLAAFGQQAKPPKGVDVDYDKFEDRTTVEVRFFLEKWSGGGFREDVHLWYEFPGDVLKVDQTEFFIAFFKNNCGSRYCFHDDDELILLIDNERLKITDNLNRGGEDYVGFKISRSSLERIGSAAKVEFKVGFIPGEFRKQDLVRIKQFIEFAKQRPADK